MTLNEKYKRCMERFDSFSKALDRLEEAFEQDGHDELQKDGVIQRFEFTFELAWKTLQDYFEAEGYTDVKGPRTVIRQAFQDHVIKDPEIWMSILEDRNRMTHTYDGNASDDVFEHIRDSYLAELGELYHALKERLQIDE
jgi:nucleotidyltransferase substrate binding protein (TIGR01987 family)